jgi:dGTPase
MTLNAKNTINSLFNYYMNNFDLVSDHYKIEVDRPRAVADFISGMTDRFALKINKSLNN